jgi:hypothetical protein
MKLVMPGLKCKYLKFKVKVNSLHNRVNI